MIKVNELTKRFGDHTALNRVSCTLPIGSVTGLVGSNGAGKSTLMRLIAGIYRPDSGAVQRDGKPIYENPSAKAGIVFVSDDLYFLEGASLKRMETLYRSIYPAFDTAYFREQVARFSLDMKKPLSAYSKGMRRQAAILLALSCRAEVLLFDETFDGLDPAVRRVVKGLICDEVAARQTTVLVASHSLRELEDLCDRLVLLHKGTVVMEESIADVRATYCKVQVAFDGAWDPAGTEGLELLSCQQQGSLFTLMVQGDFETVRQRLQALSPLLLQTAPLTLEEVFALKMQTMGYTFEWEEATPHENTTV